MANKLKNILRKTNLKVIAVTSYRGPRRRPDKGGTKVYFEDKTKV